MSEADKNTSDNRQAVADAQYNAFMDAMVQDLYCLADTLIFVSQHKDLREGLATAINQRLGRAVVDTKPKARTFCDSMAMNITDGTIDYTDGVLTADCVATAAMVQDYNGKKVLKDPEELRKACDYARQLPVTDEHPESGLVESQDEIKGWTSPVKYDNEKKRVSCTVNITDSKLIKKIQDGKRDVSIGFFCDLDEKEGEYEGDKYTAIQRNIVLNHLAAGIDEGRCPAGICGIGQDAADFPPKTEEERAMTHFKLSQEEWDKLSDEEKAKLIEQLPERGTANGPVVEEKEDKPETEPPKKEEKAEAPPADQPEYKCPSCGNIQTIHGKCEKCGAEVEEVKTEVEQREILEESKEEEEPPAKEDCDCKACPPEKSTDCSKKEDKLQTMKDNMYSDEVLAIVDAIMDYRPPQTREQLLMKSKADLKDILVLLRAKGDSKPRITTSRSKPANKDEAYRRLKEEWNKR